MLSATAIAHWLQANGCPDHQTDCLYGTASFLHHTQSVLTCHRSTRAYLPRSTRSRRSSPSSSSQIPTSTSHFFSFLDDVRCSMPRLKFTALIYHTVYSNSLLLTLNVRHSLSGRSSGTSPSCSIPIQEFEHYISFAEHQEQDRGVDSCDPM